MKKQSLKTRLFLNFFAFLGLCALQFATGCGPMPYLILQDFIILAVLTAAHAINTDSWSELQKRTLLLSAALIPGFIVFRSHIEHKSLLDSVIFFVIVLTTVGTSLFIWGPGRRAKKRQT